MIMTAALEVGQMSRYTMELGKLVCSGYEIFDGSWTTFVEMHKKELCDKSSGIISSMRLGRKLLTDSSTISMSISLE